MGNDFSRFGFVAGLRPGIVAMWLGALAAALGTAACARNDESEPATSGDPAADRRAEVRVASAEERKRDGEKDDDDEEAATLYDRLGGHEGIGVLVHDFTVRTIADPRVNFERKDVETNWFGREYKAWQPTEENVAEFERHMVEFIALAAGGPSKYTGGDMRTVHEGMKITNNEFDAMVGDIKASMEKLQIGIQEQKELLAIIETTREQIVEKR